MDSQALFLSILCMTLSVTQIVVGEVWEFGIDAPGSIIVDYKDGDFSLFQRNQEIQLKSPPCYVTEYVRVQVDNSLSNPTVNYNKLTNSVKISYKPLQYSVSNYKIVSKAARMPGCYSKNMELHMRHKFGK